LLSRFGINEIPCENRAFDPSVHEAVGKEPTEKLKPGTISKVFKKGYRLHDKVIRPGQVIVSAELPKVTSPEENEK